MLGAYPAYDFKILSTQDRLGFYPDWPVPGCYDVQKLITGSASPG